MFGLKPQQFDASYETFLENIHPDDREFVNNAYTESVNNKTPYNIVHRLKLRDGTIKYVNERCETFYDKEGKAIKSIGTVQDITERILTENKALRFNKIIEDSLNEIYIFNAETLKFVYANQGARQNIGFSQKELSNMTPLDIKPEFTAELFEQLISPLRNGIKPIITFNTVHKRKDKSLYDIEVHLQLMHYGQEEVFVAIILDITERKIAEMKLREHQEQLETLVQERTAELEKKNKILDDSMKVFVGREESIIKLTRRIKELEREVAFLKE